MRADDFNLFARLIKQRSGLVMADDKTYLLESRLPPVARKWNLKTIDDLASALRIRPDETMMHDITEAVAANESPFFRDPRSFEQFRHILLPQFLKSRAARRQIRIWSAGCAGGQEVYSLAILCAEESARLQGWTIEILGTDLSGEMIERAQTGIYSQFEVQRGLPVALLIKYFQQFGDKWQVREDLRGMAQFRAANLLQDSGGGGAFDIIFCRNVLSYFDQPTRARVLESLAGALAPDGALILGSAETAPGPTDKFKRTEGQNGLYVLARPSVRMAAG